MLASMAEREESRQKARVKSEELLATKGDFDVEPPFDVGSVPLTCAVSLRIVCGDFARVDVLALP